MTIEVLAKLVDTEVIQSKKTGELLTLATWQSDAEKSYIKTWGEPPEGVKIAQPVKLVFKPSWKNNQLYLKDVLPC